MFSGTGHSANFDLSGFIKIAVIALSIATTFTIPNF
jgi:hypothetical protein